MSLANALRRAAMFLLSCGVLLVVFGCQEESVPEVQGHEVALNDDNFDEQALQSDQLVLVEFGASWCGPCQRMEPVLAYLSDEYEGRVKVGKVDVDESLAVSKEYGIDPIPTFVILRDGRELARETGAMSYRQLSSWVEEYLPTQTETSR